MATVRLGTVSENHDGGYLSCMDNMKNGTLLAADEHVKRKIEFCCASFSIGSLAEETSQPWATVVTHNSFPWLRCFFRKASNTNISTMTWLRCFFRKASNTNISTMGNCCDSQQFPMVEMFLPQGFQYQHLNHGKLL